MADRTQPQPSTREAVDDIRRLIPSVNDLVERVISEGDDTGLGRDTIVVVVRRVLEEFRYSLNQDDPSTTQPCDNQAQLNDILITRIRTALRKEAAPPLRCVINATGIILHTGLGRAPLAPSVVEALSAVAGGYAPVEIDMESGKRGKRSTIVRSLLCELTGAQSATVVNNNAAAVMLTLASVAKDREVIVSRGELVEIGGSFRIPAVIEEGGAIMREVGTTNKTHLTDYENAINEQTAALLKVHPSNFRIAGFTQEVTIDELAALGKAHELPVIHDIGSGLLRSGAAFNLSSDEPNARDSIQQGADLVLFSGDKLLGGPQAGIIVGRKDLIERIEKHPMMRAMRVGKLTLTALGRTLQLHRDGEQAKAEIPTLRMATEPLDEVRQRAERLSTLLAEQLSQGVSCEIQLTESYLGGGSVPGQEIASYAVVLQGGKEPIEVRAESLRRGALPVKGGDGEVSEGGGRSAVLARIREGGLWFDMRTVFGEQVEALADAIAAAYGDG